MSDRDPAVAQRRYSMIVEWSDEDNAYIVTVPELPGCRTHGATRAEAVAQGAEVIELWLDGAVEDAAAVPEPTLFDHEQRSWWKQPVGA